MGDVVWVGPRESDLLYCGIQIAGSITINGSNSEDNVSFTSLNKRRIDHNTTSYKSTMSFIAESATKYLEDEQIHFMFYNQTQAYYLGGGVFARSICVNNHELLLSMNDKASMRQLVSQIAEVIPFTALSRDQLIDSLQEYGSNDKVILQERISSGGSGTTLLDVSSCKSKLEQASGGSRFMLSPYINDAIPLNVHAVIYDDGVAILPPSIQIIDDTDGRFLYLGADFDAEIDPALLDSLERSSRQICMLLQRRGYRGVCGLDFVAKDGIPLFVEINPRFQASSFLLNKILMENGCQTLHSMCINAFEHGSVEEFSSPSFWKRSGSFLTIQGDEVPFWASGSRLHEREFPCRLILDGFRSDQTVVDERSYLFKMEFDRPLTCLKGMSPLSKAPSAHVLPQTLISKLQNGDRLVLKAALLNHGVWFTEAALFETDNLKSIRSGVFQSVDIKIDDDLVVNAPIDVGLTFMSPFSVDFDGSDFLLRYGYESLGRISFERRDSLFSQLRASHGTRYCDVAFAATDRIRIHHQLNCIFNDAGKTCLFCDAVHSDGMFHMDDVMEVIDRCLEEINFRHFLIGGGSGSERAECDSIVAIAEHIRKKSEKPIYVMCLPPDDLGQIKRFFDAGVNEVSFNMEIFDRRIAQQLMPAKGFLPASRYYKAFDEAVRLFGARGNVRSIVMLGLEPMDSFMKGIESLCERGVAPIISVFRPLPNTGLSRWQPPDTSLIVQAYENAENIARHHGLRLGPSCRYCQNNTLSLTGDRLRIC